MGVILSIDKKSRIVIIPARGGSKRIPKKNIRNFAGKPIILYPLAAIQKSELFGEIHVSTEDKQIYEIVKTAGYCPRFIREEKLSGDFTTIAEVVKNVILNYQKIGIHFKTIALVYPTAVFLDPKVLVNALKKFESMELESQEMISVKRYEVPIEWAMHMNSDGILRPVDKKSLLLRSQDIVPKWHETADFVLYTSKAILDDVTEPIKRGFKLPYESVDIDDESDWKRAEKIYLSKFNC